MVDFYCSTFSTTLKDIDYIEVSMLNLSCEEKIEYWTEEYQQQKTHSADFIHFHLIYMAGQQKRNMEHSNQSYELNGYVQSCFRTYLSLYRASKQNDYYRIE